MTRTLRINSTCVLCYQTSEQNEVLSEFYADKSPYLDLRSSAEVSLSLLIQFCPHCGYCARDISEGKYWMKKVVSSDKYMKILQNPSLPELANRFLALGFIFQTKNLYKEAFYCHLQASWVCDDEFHQEGIVSCRKSAINLLKLTWKSKKEVSNNLESDKLICCDLLRRSLSVDEATEISEQGLSINKSQIFRLALLFEQDLIKQRDTGRYRFGQVPGLPQDYEEEDNDEEEIYIDDFITDGEDEFDL